MGAALVLPYANAQAVNLHLEGDLQPRDARQSRRLHLYGNDCGTHVIDNIGKKTGGKMGNFTLGCRGVGRQVQTTTARATAATIRRDVARITRRRRQIRGGEIMFSDRRGGILDMVRFLHCQNSGRRAVLLAIHMGIDGLRRHVGRMKLW